jgi:hypothetical protein
MKVRDYQIPAFSKSQLQLGAIFNACALGFRQDDVYLPQQQQIIGFVVLDN